MKRTCLYFAIKPIGHRFFVALSFFIVGLCVASPLNAQISTDSEQVLSEQEAVRRALERPALNDLWAAQIKSDEAAALRAQARSNPIFEYSREQAFEEPETLAEDYLILEQALPISGNRGLRAEAARTRARATQLETHADARKIATRVRHLFYRVLALQQRVEMRSAWIEQMREVEQKLVQRAQAGESAPYDVERLRREIADVRADAASERAELAGARAQLAGLVGIDSAQNTLRVEGELLPAKLPDDEALRRAVAGRPELAAASERGAAAQLSIDAASRWWIPELILRGGYKSVDVGTQRFHGFVAGVALDIPLFDRAAGERMEAEAALVSAKSRRALLKQQIQADASEASSKVRMLSAAADTYRTAGVERAQKNATLAQQSYDAGEVGILELIDAYHGVVGSRLRLQEMAAEARHHQIELEQNFELLNDKISQHEGE
ncbi:cobalt-zinc-cadmium efflux system outer membrane protein [Bradymonas sediminis]|nr:cobalt-zinc-cadmium efflux system outer membrane protein [Bradymonas sediminis]